MTSAAIDRRLRRRDRRVAVWDAMPRARLEQTLDLLRWMKPEVAADLVYYIGHLRNLVWCYRAQAEAIRATTPDPRARWEASVALALDDLRDPLSADDEAELQAIYDRAWGGIRP